MPYDIVSIEPKPILKKVEGWKTDTTKIKSIDEIPSQLKDYISYLETELKIPIKYLSVGPDRSQTLVL